MNWESEQSFVLELSSRARWVVSRSFPFSTMLACLGFNFSNHHVIISSCVLFVPSYCVTGTRDEMKKNLQFLHDVRLWLEIKMVSLSISCVCLDKDRNPCSSSWFFSLSLSKLLCAAIVVCLRSFCRYHIIFLGQHSFVPLWNCKKKSFEQRATAPPAHKARHRRRATMGFWH